MYVLLKKSPIYMRRNEFSRDTFYLFYSQQSARRDKWERKREKNQTNMWRAYGYVLITSDVRALVFRALGGLEQARAFRFLGFRASGMFG